MNENEKKCVDGAIRFLENSLGGARSNLWFPENDNQVPPDRRVEAICEIGRRKFAIEHTLVEPYEGFTSQHIITQATQQRLLKALGGKRPTVGVDIALPSDWSQKVSGKSRRDAFINELATVILDGFDEFSTWKANDRVHDLGSVSGIPIKGVRNGFEETDVPNLDPFLILFASDWREERPIRIRRALDTKLPKLTKWYEECETILILENQDFSLTNFQSIEDVLKSEWIKLEKPPVDYLFYISTSFAPWRMYPFILARNWTSRETNGLPNTVKFTPDELGLIAD